MISQAPPHHSFTFNWQFLNELKHKVCLSKNMWANFHFRFGIAFIKVCIILFNGKNGLFDFKGTVMQNNNNKYMIALTQRINTEISAFMAALVFNKLLSPKVLFMNRKYNRNC